MLLHTVSVVVKEHIIHLLLVVYLLNDKPRPEILQLLPQSSSFFFSLLLVVRHSHFLLIQLVSFSLRCLFFFLVLSQQTDTFFSKLSVSSRLAIRRLLAGKEILILVHVMDNVCPHGFSCF